MKMSFYYLNYLIIPVLLIASPQIINAETCTSSITDTNRYRNFCSLAATDISVFKNFRKDPTFIQIMEHVSYRSGCEFLAYIENTYPDLINYFDRFSRSNEVGNPIKYKFPGIGEISPTTLRYIKILGDLEALFGDLSGKTILEIGGGYGGQCKIIQDRFIPKKYTLIDLKEPLELAEKYLSTFSLLDSGSIYFIDSEKTKSQNCDVFISNYAFSECKKDVQKEYIEKYILNSSGGYMIFNTWQDFPLETYSHLEICEILEQNDYQVNVTAEIPQTAPQNLLIVWKKNEL